MANRKLASLLVSVGAALGCALPAAHAQSAAGDDAGPQKAFVGKCLLVVNGKTRLSGRCPIAMDPDGSFTVGAAPNKPLTYFATVTMTGKGVADGYWNEDKGANHAQTPLGTLHFDHGCWQNPTAKVCAWK